jgi:tetratricopeptide (TPR) repeat protein
MRLPLFQQGYRDAADGGPDFLLYQAVALQQQAQVQTRKEPLNEAVRLYREYLAHDPQSGVALNNLARALEDLGESQAAAECYEKAIALDDSRRLFYMENYARALGKAGDWGAATPVYRRLVKEHPWLRPQAS